MADTRSAKVKGALAGEGAVTWFAFADLERPVAGETSTDMQLDDLHILAGTPSVPADTWRTLTLSSRR